MSVLSDVRFITSVVQRSMPFFQSIGASTGKNMKIKKGLCLLCLSFCVSFLCLFNCGILIFVAYLEMSAGESAVRMGKTFEPPL